MTQNRVEEEVGEMDENPLPEVPEKIENNETVQTADTLFDLGIMARAEIKERELLGPNATYHTRVRYYFESDTANYAFFCVNICYLAFCSIRSQWQLKQDEESLRYFFLIEVFFTIYFTLHLIVNIFSLWPDEIEKHFQWNIADAVLVLGTSAIVYIKIPGYDCVLALRTFKIFQPWSHLPKFRSIYISFMATIEKAMVITGTMILIMSFYSTGGIEWFHNVEIMRDGEIFKAGEYYFASMGTAMYTMMQCVMGDAWGTGVARSIMEEWPLSGGIFFISFALFVGIVVMNLFAAIFLESFLEGRIMADISYKMGLLQTIFEVVDEDNSGVLDKEELHILREKMEQVGEDFDVDEMFQYAAKNDEDGVISFPELYSAYMCITDEDLSKHKSKYKEMENKVELLCSYLENIRQQQKEEKKKTEELHKKFDAVMTRLEVHMDSHSASSSSKSPSEELFQIQT